MDPFTLFMDFVLHLDQYLALAIQAYGLWTYAFLFLIVFLETGLVVTPFLPGDSLLFAAGAFAAMGSFNLVSLFVVLSAAAILGDAANYWIGYNLGRKLFRKKSRFLKKEYLEDAQKFYQRHGKATIFLARFIPIIRTFAPFVAGMGKMRYRDFALYNVFGGMAWVATFLLAGFWFGNIPLVRDNFSLVIMAIVLISLVPALIGYIQHRKRKARK